MDHLKKLGNKGWAVLDVVGQQSNKLANKLGAEAFWPMTLDKESEKAAAILRTFTKDGFQVKAKDRDGNHTKSLVKIPPKVLQEAKGLAIFTVLRTGLHISGASGSGILIARLPDGTFGPPSGILLHTVGLGFLIGIDIYDTVLVLRTQEAVNAFAHPKVSIGAELSVAAGPLGSGGGADIGFKDKAPAWVYTKSKGFYAGIALDGTIVVERHDENARFYGQKIKAADLIKGAVSRPRSTDGLIAAIEMAERRTTGQDYGVPGGLSPPFEQGGWPEPQYPYDKAPPLPTRSSGDYSTYDQPTAGSSRLEAPFPSMPGAEFGMVPPLPARRSPTSQGNTYSGGDKEYPPDSKSDTLYADLPPAYSNEDIKIGDKRST